MKSKSFCVLPFLHLATHPTGMVTPCCNTVMSNGKSMAKEGNKFLLLNVNDIPSIINSEGFKNIRRQMLEGVFPEECELCYSHEKNGLESKRIRENKKYEENIPFLIKSTEKNGHLKNIDFKFIELRLGNLCNLKCITCNSFSSVRWNEDVSVFRNTSFQNQHPYHDNNNDWYENNTFYNELMIYSKNVKDLWINGGEPTLNKEHINLLKEYIKNDNAKNINLKYTINLTTLPDSLINLWKEFKTVNLQLSIDDIGKRNDYIRFGSKWDKVFENFLKVYQHKDVFQLEICQTVSLLNICNLNEFKKFFKNYNIMIAHNFVMDPEYLHVSYLPKKMKRSLINNTSALSEDEKNKLVFELNKKNDGDINKFYDFISLLDKKRKTKMVNYLKEWEEKYD